MKSNAGLTLIETMIACVLGWLVLHGFVNVYLAIQGYFSRQLTFLNAAEDIRFASLLFNEVIHKAGYQGDATSTFPAISPYNAADVKPGTAAFTINYMDTITNDVVEDMTVDHQLVATASPVYRENDTIMISDHETSEVFQVDHVITMHQIQIITTKNPLLHQYKSFSMLGLLHHDSYYIAPTHRFDSHGKKIDALFKKDAQRKKTEIMEGVSDMQLRYAVIQDDRLFMRQEPKKEDQLAGLEVRLTFAEQKKGCVYVALR